MSLFQKVFSQHEAGAPASQIQTSYDLAMAPEPDEQIGVDELAKVLSDAATSPPSANDMAEAKPEMPDPAAVAEAQSLLETVQAPQEAPKPEPLQTPATSNRRAKTRLLGFNPSADDALDPIRAMDEPTNPESQMFPVAWLVVIEGEGRGAYFPMFDGVSYIGRGEDQTIRIDFGDNSISRHNHAALAFDPEQSKFFLGHGGKSNIIRLNEAPVLSTEEVHGNDKIRIGETTLRLIALCGPNFSWEPRRADV